MDFESIDKEIENEIEKDIFGSDEDNESIPNDEPGNQGSFTTIKAKRSKLINDYLFSDSNTEERPRIFKGSNEKGSSVRDTVYNYLSKNYSKATVAGIMGNLQVESNFNPTAIGDNGNAFGLFQHNGKRMTALQNWAKNNNLDVTDPITQIKFAEQESDFKNYLKQIQENTTNQEASDLFMNTFERPAERKINSKVRGAYAQQFNDGGKI